MCAPPTESSLTPTRSRRSSRSCATGGTGRPRRPGQARGGEPLSIAERRVTRAQDDATSARASSDGSVGIRTRRLCGWCRGPIRREARADAVYCCQSCRQAAHRFGRAVTPAAATSSATSPRLCRSALPGPLGLLRRAPGLRRRGRPQESHRAALRRVSRWLGPVDVRHGATRRLGVVSTRCTGSRLGPGRAPGHLLPAALGLGASRRLRRAQLSVARRPTTHRRPRICRSGPQDGSGPGHRGQTGDLLPLALRFARRFARRRARRPVPRLRRRGPGLGALFVAHGRRRRVALVLAAAGTTRRSELESTRRSSPHGRDEAPRCWRT